SSPFLASARRRKEELSNSENWRASFWLLHLCSGGKEDFLCTFHLSSDVLGCTLNASRKAVRCRSCIYCLAFMVSAKSAHVEHWLKCSITCRLAPPPRTCASEINSD